MPGLLVHKRAFVSTIVTALALSGVADISVPARAASVAWPLLGFATPDDGWLTLGSTTCHTTNGGLTWHAA